MTLTATINPPPQGVEPTGTVEFYDGTDFLGSSPVDSGEADLTLPTLSGGSHDIQAVYSGDDTYNSETGTFTDTIEQLTPEVTLTSDWDPSRAGQPVAYTIQVRGPNSGDPSPTGSVTVYDNGQPIGSAQFERHRLQRACQRRGPDPVGRRRI